MAPMFDGLDAVVLARAQFAFTVSFHIIFPAFSIGLASYSPSCSAWASSPAW
jgi:cytochrome d ubiquinol oxidase subunit I